MADFEKGLYLIPEHMHDQVRDWVTKGTPHPRSMGEFLKAVLCNELVNSVHMADDKNRAALVGWARFLYDYLPSPAWGSLEKLDAWHSRIGEPGVFAMVGYIMDDDDLQEKVVKIASDPWKPPEQKAEMVATLVLDETELDSAFDLSQDSKLPMLSPLDWIKVVKRFSKRT